MRLMEILKEVQIIEQNNIDDQKLIKIIKENYYSTSSLDESFSSEMLNEMSMTDAKREIKLLMKKAAKKFEKIKPALISGFTSGKTTELKQLLAKKEYTRTIVDYFNLLKTAHSKNGDVKGIQKQAKDAAGKKFFYNAFNLIDSAVES